MEIITEQELDKLWLDMSFTQDYINNKKVYRKLRGNYSILIEENNILNKGIDELIEKLSIQLNCYYKNPQELGDKIIKDLEKLKGE